MAENHKRSGGKDSLKRETSTGHESTESGAENCRCKEPLGKTPSEMIKIMLRDLAFWKREKTGPGS
jgi:hypothetical protein